MWCIAYNKISLLLLTGPGLKFKFHLVYVYKHVNYAFEWFECLLDSGGPIWVKIKTQNLKNNKIKDNSEVYYVFYCISMSNKIKFRLKYNILF